MRFAELHSLPVFVALCVVTAGCSSGPPAEPLGIRTSAAESAAARVGPRPAAPVAASVPAAVEPADQPVSPAIQRAFDDATKALRAGRTEEAERGFKSLAQSFPQLGGPHANLGLIYRQAGKLPEAVAELELAVRSSPNQVVYLNQMGITYRQAGQFTKARDAYERAVALDPNYAAAVLNLGVLNDLYLWEPKRALELYDRYLALTPGGDPTVTKWAADLKNRRPAQAAVPASAASTSSAPARKEKE